jgi:hypothetical protein
MNPVEYQPVYDTTVKEYPTDNPGNWDNVQRDYCLMPNNARMLASLFPEKPVVIMGPPWPQAPGSPFAFNHPVPLLKFPDGTIRNAGLLGSYRNMPGLTAATWFAEAELDVNTPVGV